MQKLITFLVATLVMTLWSLKAPAEAVLAFGATPEAKYAVVVNTENSVEFENEEAARHEVKKLFLKSATEWHGGLEAKPFARDAGDAVQSAFVKEVLEMDKAELARHWVSVKNKNGVTPPKEVGSDKMLGKYIGKYEGGLGFMEVTAANKADVRILFEY